MYKVTDKDGTVFHVLAETPELASWHDRCPNPVLSDTDGDKWAWIARDADGTLHVFAEEPVKEAELGCWQSTASDAGRRLDAAAVERMEDKATAQVTVEKLISMLRDVPYSGLPVYVDGREVAGVTCTETLHMDGERTVREAKVEIRLA